ncbi:MAG: metal-dependent hydrolase, partial [Planctomycetota bacterium]|nr:metal-dependent hydrolase [Planctomycetota bacterium]
MDTLTHALAGTVISDGWFRRRLGPAATPFSFILAALPDIDLLVLRLASSGDDWYAHRGYSHSLLATAAAAPLIGLAAARLSGKPKNCSAWALLALLCLWSHILLDVATSWGTMLFLPFSDARIALDAAPILDCFVFAVSLASCIANRLLRRERVDVFLNPLIFPVVHRHPMRVRAAAWIARPAAVLILCYLAIGWLQSRQTAGIARKELAAAGVEAEEIRAMPILFTHLAWSVAARDAAGNLYNALYSSFAPRPMRFVRRPAAGDRAAKTAL